MRYVGLHKDTQTHGNVSNAASLLILCWRFHFYLYYYYYNIIIDNFIDVAFDRVGNIRTHLTATALQIRHSNVPAAVYNIIWRPDIGLLEKHNGLCSLYYKIIIISNS